MGESASELKRFMSASVKTEGTGLTLYEACHIMRDTRTGYLIIEDRGQPVGIVTEEDIIRRAIPENMDMKITTVRQVMSTPAPTVESSATTEDVNSLMKLRGCRVVVVMEHGKVVGAITLLGLLWCLEARGRWR